jgi:hypothetical protein
MIKIMRLTISRLLLGGVLAAAFYSGTTLACDPDDDGCLGCTDQELPACMDQLVVEICNTGGSLENCDRRRVYDDLERQVITNTGRHMVRINVMMRSARKYQMH